MPVFASTGNHRPYRDLFIHPFGDGNGQMHRFLIHDFLGREGVVSAETVLPVSAYMLHHSQEYDQVRESCSKPLRTIVSINIDDNEQLTIHNPGQASGSYRYPNPTRPAHYLLQAVAQTISTDLVTEILLIRGYDHAKVAICAVVDMPNARLDLLIKLLYRNKGSLSEGKRSLFKEISDQELARIELTFHAAFAEQTIELDDARSV